MFAGVGMAGAALRNWVLNLNAALDGKGVFAGHIAIGAWLTGTPGAPEGVPLKHPDDLAHLYWDLHTARKPADTLVQ
ncbi:hypothetical protein [Actinomadura rupiterrae]|uniref:hypothetical protein n=1 Tax=Actinomadura rupiterrae TaxID=559627 RepID=UPI0020A5D205|nr:hypothetical protein [Actinomadura rupiterrae]MCP2338967.1 hypothetical protein [Actinomadura rupiterrae]